MPFVTPKGTSSTAGSGPGASGRTTFRPPWVKDDAAAKTPAKTSVPWAKKTADAEKENGEKPATNTKAASGTAVKKTSVPAGKVAENNVAAASKKPTETSANTKKVVEPLKKNAEPAKKSVEPPKKTVEPVKKIVAPVKKTPEPVAKKTAVSTPGRTSAATAKKKEPTPSSSEEEEETDDEEEETEEEESEEEESEEEESEDESEPTQSLKMGVALKKTPQPKPKDAESELTRRFSIEKPKLRPVVKRDKSMKKVEDDDDADAEEGETEEERERRLRFKLEKPKLRHVKREEKPLPSKSTEDIMKIRPVLKKVPKIDELMKEPKEEPKPEFKTKQLRKPSLKNVPAPPPLPSLVPKAPPPPPPLLGPAGEKRDLSNAQKAVLEKLKTRPRRRPDWSEMMKEVESGQKLRHVVCNDRSQPVLTCKSMTKVDDKFIYETEKGNSHNKLLKQIQGGIRLKPTRTNDRSKPVLEGLRKFRKQMTIEEQIQKSQSKINMLAEPTANNRKCIALQAAGASVVDGDIATMATRAIVAALSIDDPSGDELDDIDNIRDDLQSTKQMLALELRNREAQERENKKLMAQIATLEAELEREKSREKNLEYGSRIIVATMEPSTASETAYLAKLKQEADDARQEAKDLEKKYHVTGEQYDQAKSELEEQKRQIQMLERKLAQVLQGNMASSPCPYCSRPKRPQFNFCYSYEDPNDADNFYGSDNYANGLHAYSNHKGGGSLNSSRRPSDALGGRESSPDLDFALSESDPDEPEEKKVERRERRMGKEVKLLKSKLTKLKVKQEAAKKEKLALKQAMKKNHVILKEENKKFKKLEKEVQKMAASMKEDEEDEDADEDKDEDEPEEEAEAQESEEEEESEESESEESEAETESESEAEDASNTDKKNNLEPRVKKHEGRFSAMKKCNVLLQANVDNLQDEITQVRSKAASLQSELDAVLADLGL